ncbi:hypothetical protein M23134_00251 [Microscilla marina ATCC 23134]|uniref:Uncharacterized protein n=1 Tax=Microscilla marina ATCC 23134 TaxID=313606 RepID=A1ZP18_MICM2|nr:hypothetical protein M23134_00251 [Microscilla marina ATCC 23134]
MRKLLLLLSEEKVFPGRLGFSKKKHSNARVMINLEVWTR